MTQSLADPQNLEEAGLLIQSLREERDLALQQRDGARAMRADVAYLRSRDVTMLASQVTRVKALLRECAGYINATVQRHEQYHGAEELLAEIREVLG